MQANKYKLLKNLQETYCSFSVSKVHGIGVFAIRDIPVNTNPFPVVKPEKIIQLTEEDLVNILSKVENNLIFQYKELFNHSEINLEVNDDSLSEIAKLAKQQKTGARGLRSILENVLLDYMFELKDAIITVDDVKKIQSQLGRST